MRIVAVKFNGSEKAYEYQTDIQLISGGEYKITADNETTYRSTVTVLGYKKRQSYNGNLRTITKADCVNAPKMEDDNIENVWFNEDKHTTVVRWKDGIITKVTCAASDKFDKEKALALCYMKRFFKNRGGFNNVIAKWTNACK